MEERNFGKPDLIIITLVLLVNELTQRGVRIRVSGSNFKKIISRPVEKYHRHVELRSSEDPRCIICQSAYIPQFLYF